MSKDNTIRLKPLYIRRLNEHNYQIDNAQIDVIERLQLILDRLMATPSKRSWISRLTTKNHHSTDKTASKGGLYLWGGVGRGKTYIIDFFYEVLPIEKKLRLHYYEFMQQVHNALKAVANHKDPLKIVAAQLALRTRVLFLDEFFVSDITDAMILYGLLAALFEYQVVIITTSNFAPKELYKDGLQRQRFLPAITLIEQCTDVVELPPGVDYRTQHLKDSGSYHSPCNRQSQTLMKQCFTKLATGNINSGGSISINDRTIEAIMHTPNVVWFDFKEICQTPRSVADYISIARLYHTVLISKVPVFNNRDDAARRFIQLIDEFYDKNVILVLSAATPANRLYEAGRLEFEFNRTTSRLLEMQSRTYWSKARLS
ncbi:MAG: cell division protein ZapE [Chromatiales bacterium]|nr:cell division protein ZapE [Chromatiales bacterium]